MHSALVWMRRLKRRGRGCSGAGSGCSRGIFRLALLLPTGDGNSAQGLGGRCSETWDAPRGRARSRPEPPILVHPPATRRSQSPQTIKATVKTVPSRPFKLRIHLLALTRKPLEHCQRGGCPGTDTAPRWSSSDHELVAPQEDKGLGCGAIGLGVPLVSPSRPPIWGLFGFWGGSFHTLQFLFAFLRVEGPTCGELWPLLGITERPRQALRAPPRFGGLAVSPRSVKRRFGVHLEALPGQVGQAGGGRLGGGGGGGDGGVGWLRRLQPRPGVPSQPARPLGLGGAQGGKCYTSLCRARRTTDGQNLDTSQCPTTPLPGDTCH